MKNMLSNEKMKKPLPVGKLESDILEKIVFDNITFKNPDVLIRAGVGEDCSVVNFGEYECIMSTDPITAAATDIGRLAIHITANDIASNGVQPLGIMLALMLPVGTTIEDVELIMKQAGETAAELGIEIIGGHTEVTPAVNTPVIVSTAIGKAEKGKSQQATDMRPGDLIIMTKYAGIEGTGIIASDFEGKLLSLGFSKEEIDEAKSLLMQVSVVKEGIIAGKIGTCGIHDITEGGVLGAVWEMCQVSGTGCRLWVDQIPVLEVTKKIAEAFDINYLRLISSGCMLIVVTKEKRKLLMNALEEAGIMASCIGEVRGFEEGILKYETMAGAECNSEAGHVIMPPGADELYKVVK